MSDAPSFQYPDLPIARHREEIKKAITENQVVIVVGETGSGKTTQLPKMALEVAGNRRGKLGCTQPRRLAAVAVSRRIAEEVNSELGGYVGYQVRFDDRTSKQTKLKLMTDGILLAETQDNPDLKQYHTIILDEAHERSLNIDFLLGYMKLLLARRPDLKLIISSATMDSAAFSDFFDKAPVIHAEGRSYGVEMHYMPPQRQDEELPDHVCRAVDWLSGYDSKGDVLIFLPGEREIRDCADALQSMDLSRTLILPLYARLGLGEQQKIFQTGGSNRRIVLATNVAETSLTIPGIIYVIDSGLARISRYLPGRQIQRLQVEDISQASARQRAGRCGRVCEGVCIRLYSEEDFNDRDAFTDPEIKRSALAGVILRMADLKLPPLGVFPLPDPPSTRLINEGYHCLREVGALDRKKELTDIGHKLAKLPLDPRLGRILIEGKTEGSLAEMLVIVAGLSIMDPRERPADDAAKADQAQAQWKVDSSDYLSLIKLWRSSLEYREGHRGWKRNQLRKWCKQNYLNFLRIIEWHNLAHDLAQALAQGLRWRIPALEEEAKQASDAMIHRSILAGAPLHIGIWRPEEKNYRGAGGRDFNIFPGSGLFKRKKRPEWIMGSELVETTRLWMRRCAILDPIWVEQVAPQLCNSHAYDPHWDKASGQVYAKLRVNCGGLTIADGRRVSYARINPKAARDIFIRDGIMEAELRDTPPFIAHLKAMREAVELSEAKLRRRDLLWCSEGVYAFFDRVLPQNIASEKALRQWRSQVEKKNKKILFVPFDECTYPGEGDTPEELYPDELCWQPHDSKKPVGYPLYYKHDPGAPDDGVTMELHVDQLHDFPDWLPAWQVPAHLPHRADCLLRALPKDVRNFLHPIAESAQRFADEHDGNIPDRPLEQALAEFVIRSTGAQKFCNASQFAEAIKERLLPEYITKIIVTSDKGKVLAQGTDITALREGLSGYQEKRLENRAQKVQKKLYSDTPMTRWDCGDLATEVQLGNQKGYPALQEESERAVKVAIFPSQEEADAVHRQGVMRLAMLRHGDFVNHFRKSQKMPFTSMEARLALTTLGMDPKNNINEIVKLAMEGAMQPLPRTAADFDAACLRLREKMFDILKGPITKLWNRLVEVEQAIKIFKLTAGKDRYNTQIADELLRQWNWLTRPHFLSSGGYARLNDMERYLRGILERIQRIKQQAAARELDRMSQLENGIANYYAQPLVAETFSGKNKKPLPPAYLSMGYMIEEYRLTLFSPSLAQKGRASTKKLAEAAEALRK